MTDNTRLELVQELNALKLLMENSDSFIGFFNDNFEYINIKKKFLSGWIGFEHKKNNPDIFNLNVKNLIRMYYIDIKYGEKFSIDTKKEY